jgi:hypothetical protein
MGNLAPARAPVAAPSPAETIMPSGHGANAGRALIKSQWIGKERIFTGTSQLRKVLRRRHFW